MKGIQVSQARAADLAARGFEIHLSPSTLFWICTDNVSRQDFTYKIYKTGDKEDQIPSDAFPFEFEMSLSEAADLSGLAYSTLAQAAREGRIEARRSGATWLTTRVAIKEAIEKGHLKPSKQ